MTRSARDLTTTPVSGSLTKEELAQALVHIRQAAELTQTQLAARADWPKSVASRIESPAESFPDLSTLARYACACDVDVGLLFTAPHDGLLQVHSALTLQSAHHQGRYESLQGEPLVVVPEGEEGE